MSKKNRLNERLSKVKILRYDDHSDPLKNLNDVQAENIIDLGSDQDSESIFLGEENKKEVDNNSSMMILDSSDADTKAIDDLSKREKAIIRPKYR